MNNFTLYIIPVLIWGSTWFAITFQLGKVPPEVSVAYRFALASVLLLAWAWVRRLPLRYPARAHGWFALQGALLFGLNYVCVYLAETLISSGLVAVVFSLIVFFNIAGTRLFFGTPLKPATLLGAALGVGGVALVFLPQTTQPAGAPHATLGLLYALIGTASASLGNLVSARNQRRGIPVLQLNAYGMLYGAAFVAAYALLRGRPFTFDAGAPYVGSLLYLAVFGSIVAFGAYLTLVGRIGADRAGYTNAMVPIVALLLSVAFEHLTLNVSTVIGIVACIAGNVLVLRRKRS
jgi:drug/metabolite transporter (DMT)-like permease